MWYNRTIYASLQDHAQTKQVTVLTGMRRTGKTTLLKKLMEDSGIQQQLFFDLERIDNRELFSEKNYETIIYALQQRGIVFSEKVIIGIDEIQLVPNLPSVIKYLYDTYQIKFILTGSSSYYLKNRFNESLAGRKKIFEIYPLSFGEFLTFKEIPFVKHDDFTKQPFFSSEFERVKPYYADFIQYGGFPEVVLTVKSQEKMDLLSDIISSYINLDIASVNDFAKSHEVYKLVKLLAARIGTKLEVSKLCVLAGLSRLSVENYLHLFEQSYLIRTIPVSTTNPDREIVKARKLYFMDHGIAGVLAEIGSGSKFENAVFNQLHHKGDVSYYSLKNGKEIDFILDQKKAFEVKETASEHDLIRATSLSKNLGIDQNFVIGRNADRVFEGFIWGGSIL
jgi:predicted AAA+ superfamily ATPase